jgi:phage-related protein
VARRDFKFVNEAAKRAFKALPQRIKQQFGLDLQAVQDGLKPFSAFKDISGSVGAGAIELIVNGSNAYRAVYCAKYLNTIYILHAFIKTTNGVDQAAMDTARKRYKLMKAEVDEAARLAKKQAARTGKNRNG